MSFRVLETTRFRRADGERGERTTGFNCVCFNEAIAENYIVKYARKGVRAVVQGHAENDTWTGRGTILARGSARPSEGATRTPDLDDEIPF